MFTTRPLSAQDPKVAGSLPVPRQAGPMSVIVRVNKPGHVPAAATVRSRIDDLIFTAEIDAARLPEVTADPHVVAVSAADRIAPARR